MAFSLRSETSGTQRGRSRFRRMLTGLVTSRALWPGLVGVAIAVGLGVQAGESTISLINPIHYRGEAPPIRAFDPNAQQAPAEASYADAYGWAAGDAARRTDSGIDDFGSMPQARVQPAVAPGAPPASLAPWPPGEVGPPAAPRPEPHVQIDHFTDFPIETKPATGAAGSQPAPPPAAAPAPGPAAALSPAQAASATPNPAQ